VAYDSGTGEIFVTEDIGGSGFVSVISDASNSVVASVPVGSEQFGMAYDSGMGEVFAAGGGVSVISDVTNTVVATIPGASASYGVAYDSGTGEVFVADNAGSSVSVISDASNAVVATVPVGSNPFNVAYDSGMGEVFVANYVSNTVSVISDGSTAAGFVHGELSWTHHLSLATNPNGQNWTAVVKNLLTHTIYYLVLIQGSSVAGTGNSFDVMCGGNGCFATGSSTGTPVPMLVPTGPIVQKGPDFTQMIPFTPSDKFCFNATLIHGNTPTTVRYTDNTKSGCFAIVP
jgi:YVTN family beta-propeller protein